MHRAKYSAHHLKGVQVKMNFNGLCAALSATFQPLACPTRQNPNVITLTTDDPQFCTLQSSIYKYKQTSVYKQRHDIGLAIGLNGHFPAIRNMPLRVDYLGKPAIARSGACTSFSVLGPSTAKSLVRFHAIQTAPHQMAEYRRKNFSPFIKKPIAFPIRLLLYPPHQSAPIAQLVEQLICNQ